MSFNRRRVALACSFCRHKKRRCDATRPSCRGCVDAGVDCLYDDTPVKRIDSSGGSREIIGRLQDIEAILQKHLPAISASTSSATHVLDTLEAAAAASSLGSPSSQTWPSSVHPVHQTIAVDDATDPAQLPPLTIPVGHKTSSNYLLCLPAMRQLIGEYPGDLFFLLESRNALPPGLSCQLSTPPTLPDLSDRAYLDCLVAGFFAHAYPCHPILDRDEFDHIYDGFLNSAASPWTVDSALCLVVFAVGAAALAPPGATDLQASPPGMAFMETALPTLISMSSWSFGYDLRLPKALVLASVYFAYIARPLQSWRLVYTASSLLQFKLCRLPSQNNDASTRESILRIFWSCFLVECDRLAELELPQSGLQQLIDQTSLPSFDGTADSSQSTAYLAEISIRRLLNRVHNSLYPRKQSILTLSSTALAAGDEFSAEELGSLVTVRDELNRQLNLWYESIPEPYRPSLGSEPASNEREMVLRIRYFAARHIIHRPFVLYLVTPGLQVAPDDIVDKAGICIDSCRAYLHNTASILKTQSQYTWTFSLSSLGCLVVLTLASRSVMLADIVPDIDELQSLAIANVKPWAYPGSSLEAVVSIMEDMQRKQRLLSCI